jgi:hypothetical protein
MRIFRIHENEQNQFAESPEIAMDLNFGRSGSNFYLVVSCRMAVLLDENTFAEPEDSYFQPSESDRSARTKGRGFSSRPQRNAEAVAA